MNKLESGRWNKLPHYAVHGHPQDFYLWVNEDGHGSPSTWIKGAYAFSEYNKMRNMSNKDLVAYIKKLHSENQ